MEAGSPRTLAVSDHQGQIFLLPETSVQWVSLFSEAKIFLDLWLCKRGFGAMKVVDRGGWNVDLRPAEIHRLGTMALKPVLESEGCDLDA